MSETTDPTPTTQDHEFDVKARTQAQLVVRRFLHHRLAMISLVVLVLMALLAFAGARVWGYDHARIPQNNLESYNAPSLTKPAGRCRPIETVAVPTNTDPGVTTTVDRLAPAPTTTIAGATGDTGDWRADFIAKYPRDHDLSCAPHLFGTNQVGQDLFAQTLRGTQRSLLIAIMVAIVSTTLGVLIGAAAGFFRGWLDAILMRMTDLILTVPYLAVAAVLGRKVSGDTWWVIPLILGGFGWMGIARIIRGEFLSLREKEFVEAARASGATSKRIIFKHMLPNAVGPIIVNATLSVAGAILAETALSFLGLGVKSPDVSLGSLVSENQTAFSTHPWLFWFPGLFIIVIVLCVNFIGDGLRDAFDPKQNRVRA